MKSENYYVILGVRDDADEVVISAAYRALAKKYHPDTSSSKGNRSTNQFRLVQQAYDVLGDHDKRKAYDEKVTSEHHRKSGNADTGDKEKRSSKTGFNEEKPQPAKSQAEAASQKRVILQNYFKRYSGLTVIACLVGVTIVWAFYQSKNNAVGYTAHQFLSQTETPKVNSNAEVTDIAPIDHGKDIYGRDYPSVNSIGKGDSKTQVVGKNIQDLYGRDQPYINSSGKGELSLKAENGAAPLKCKLYIARVVGNIVIEQNNRTEDVLCLEKLRYDESAGKGIISPELEPQKLDQVDAMSSVSGDAQKSQ